MEEKDLLKKIHNLESQLQAYQNKEQYINDGVVKTKEVYDVARHNAEKIIARAVMIAHDLKADLNNLIDALEADQSVANLRRLIQKYQKIFAINKEEVKLLSEKLVNKVKK
ncbi:hypothetical protein SCLARK_00789 [Spiroplasma clarkii]|uniref:Uncharacterized protein n=1 Tax=Spiroplasma clarkii TaxID=2139 RepID=A0A1Y0L0W7_9MOLU|nr:hypothetical protein [Spiroplasma clarkii]ARU91420.1 hypothetical protein SCLARK_00789 [Spiroplasma clarkii]ATX70836.1 hypothetical protein SCLAR_v1c05170 [Spiroplasma clarkii]